MDAVEDYARMWIKRDNGNRLIFEIWWNFFYDLFSIKNVADVDSIDSFLNSEKLNTSIGNIISR
jgi:hypothetical protein